MSVPFPTGRRVFFITPHQDDETISMGLIISHHSLAGRRTSVVPGAKGETTTAINAINGTTANGWWGGTHNLTFEDRTPVTTADIGDCRDRELMDACAQLGVLASEVYFPVAPRISAAIPPADYVATATAVIQEIRALDPAAGIYTMHWDDIDPQHAAYGQALKNLHDANPAAYSDIRWVVRESQATETGPDHIPAEQYIVPGTYLSEAKLMVQHAARAYQAWAPHEQRYAVGYHSVGVSLWPGVVAGNPNWIVRP